MPKCPCDKLANGERSYHCDLFGCKMFPHFCRAVLTDSRWMNLYLRGMGPTQRPEQKGDRSKTLKAAEPAPSEGPGTELKKILTGLGVTPGNCACEAHATEMNRRGAAWCWENIELIGDWLAAQAKKRKWMFSRSVAKMLVRWAIRRAEKKAAGKG